MQPKICAFTGHRPTQIPNSNNEQSPDFRVFYASIETAIRQAITEGFTLFRGVGGNLAPSGRLACMISS